jgi:hypothetical protein
MFFCSQINNGDLTFFYYSPNIRIGILHIKLKTMNMKKIYFLFLFTLVSVAAFSQGINLAGTFYLQKFDSLGIPSYSSNNGLPPGWSVRTGASGQLLGTDVGSISFIATYRNWDDITGQFRNCASADAFLYQAGSTDALQDSCLNRCLAVRQDNQANTNFPNSDSGSAFVLEIANTTGLAGFMLQFKLQSLDSGNANPPIYDTITHKATWSVDYGFGASPDTFYMAPTTGIMTTGGCVDSLTGTYSNNAISVNFGTNLDNQTGPVWIRIVTRQFSTYCTSGLKPTTGIDDYYLTYSAGGDAGVAKTNSNILPLTIVGNSTTSQVSMEYYIEQAGDYQIGIFDLMGRQVYSGLNYFTIGDNKTTVRDLNLQPGMYVVKVGNANVLGVAKTIVQ